MREGGCEDLGIYLTFNICCDPSLEQFADMGRGHNICLLGGGEHGGNITYFFLSGWCSQLSVGVL